MRESNSNIASNGNEFKLTPHKQPTTFLTLPAELRTYIYELSSCLKVSQCKYCNLAASNQLPSEFFNRNNLHFWMGCCAKCSFRQRVHYDEWTPRGLHAHEFLWVNRCSHVQHDRTNDQTASSRRPMRRVTCWMPHAAMRCLSYWTHCERHIDGVSQPALTRVSRLIRQETLPMFYGGNTFLFTLLDAEIDGVGICAWLKTIGAVNAASLSDVRVVYLRGKDRKYIEKTLFREIRVLGVVLAVDVVTVSRLRDKRCCCEFCIRKSLE